MQIRVQPEPVPIARELIRGEARLVIVDVEDQVAILEVAVHAVDGSIRIEPGANPVVVVARIPAAVGIGQPVEVEMGGSRRVPGELRPRAKRAGARRRERICVVEQLTNRVPKAFDVALWNPTESRRANGAVTANAASRPATRLQLIGITEDKSGIHAALYDPDADRLWVVGSGDTIPGQRIEKLTASEIVLVGSTGTSRIALRKERP